MAVIDTCVLFAYLQGEGRAKVAIEGASNASISVASRYIIFREAQKLPPLIRQETQRFINSFSCIAIDDRVAALASELQSRYSTVLSDIGALVIASARSQHDVLITLNNSLEILGSDILVLTDTPRNNPVE